MKSHLTGWKRSEHRLSLPVRGAWVEIAWLRKRTSEPSTSLPVRGAWVEIGYSIITDSIYPSRSPCGERGLKCLDVLRLNGENRRSPCGERGLKLRQPALMAQML